MNGSIVAIIYLVGLVLFFILLVIMTIIVIVSKSNKKSNSKHDAEKANAAEAPCKDIKQEDSGAESIFDEAEDEFSDSAFGYMGDVSADAVTEELIGEEFAAERYVEDNADAAYAEDVVAEAAESESIAGEDLVSEADDSESTGTEDIAPEITESGSAETEGGLAQVSDMDDMEAEELIDSAFAPESVSVATGLTNEEITASVREAEAMGAAVIGGMGVAGVSADTIFGISEEMAKYGSRKKSSKKSEISSDEDFYWYNKMDLAAKPSYKTTEMYYHYFNLPKDCIEDLLIEMYDCALVRTEEIRYIAYGIAPRAVSMKEILSYGNSNYVPQQKQKEPTTQDLVRIYEKWCGYVDKLFDKVEIHADDLTIEEIRKLLYEYGKSDVDILIEGK